MISSLLRLLVAQLQVVISSKYACMNVCMYVCMYACMQLGWGRISIHPQQPLHLPFHTIIGRCRGCREPGMKEESGSHVSHSSTEVCTPLKLPCMPTTWGHQFILL